MALGGVGADENLSVARDSYNSDDLKKGFTAIKVAKANADEAYETALQKTAEKEANEAAELVDRAEKSPGAAVAKDEMAGAKESLNNAKGTLSSRQFKESISASEEAKRLATLVLNAKQAEPEGPDVSKRDDEKKGYRTYKVKFIPNNRDCLWKISQKEYKTPLKWKKIYEANRELIKDPNMILPGWELKIPADTDAEEKKGTEEKKTEAPTGEVKDKKSDEFQDW